MAVNHIRSGHSVVWTNDTGSSVASGAPVVMGNRIGVVQATIASLATGVVLLTDTWSFAKTVGVAFAVGDDVWLDLNVSPFAASPIGDVWVGKCVEAAASAATTIKVTLTDPGPAPQTRKVYFDDFFGFNRVALDAWKATVTGTVTASAQASGSGGVFRMCCANTSEVENICLDHGNVLGFDIAKGVIFEARVKFVAIPAAAGSIVSIGLASARNDTPGTITELALFQLNANGDLQAETDDGTKDINAADTGVDVVNNDWLVLKIDTRNQAAVKFFVNGTDVTAAALTDATETAFTMAAASTGLVQPYFQVQKTANAGTPEILVDWVKITQEH